MNKLPFYLILLGIGFTGSAVGDDVIEVKELEAKIKVDKENGITIFRSEIRPSEIYRNGEKRVERKETKVVWLIDGKSKMMHSIVFTVFAKGREIVRIAGPHQLSAQTVSPWPIMTRMSLRELSGKGEGSVEIAIPELDYYENLNFEAGDLKPLPTGEHFREFRERRMREAKELLGKEPESEE